MPRAENKISDLLGRMATLYNRKVTLSDLPDSYQAPDLTAWKKLTGMSYEAYLTLERKYGLSQLKIMIRGCIAALKRGKKLMPLHCKGCLSPLPPLPVKGTVTCDRC